MNTIFNIYPVIKIIVVILAVVGLFNILQVLIHAIKDTKLNSKHIDRELGEKRLDSDIIQELVKKFPDVSEEFMKKPERLQNIENNQEIHEIKKQLRSIGETRKNG